MLKIEKKEYEIEEKIQLEEKGQVVYEFTMQITPEEMLEIKKYLFDYTEDNIKDYLLGDDETRKEFETQNSLNLVNNQEKLIDIWFKEHKEPFKEKAGEYKFNEMVEMIQSFFINFFVEKKLKQVRMPISNLTKMFANSTNYR